MLTHYTRRPRERYGLHGLLFVLTFVCTTLMGGLWAGRDLLYAADAWMAWPDLGLFIGPSYLLDGLRFSVPFLLFLTVHEFGHYFAARRHRVSTSLPFYIPVPFGIGTLGAVIAIREPIPTTRKLFDVGAAGPLAGFVVALAAFVYGLATLPGPEYFAQMSGHEWLQGYLAQHGTYPQTWPEGTDPQRLGRSLLVAGLVRLFPGVPPFFEIYHHPVVLAGWMGLFFTALNLLPVGQLDGGHVVYSLLGPRLHARIARATVLVLMLSGGIGLAAYAVPLIEAWQAGAGVATWIGLAAFYALLLRPMFGPSPRVVLPVAGGLLALAALAVWLGPPVTQYAHGPWLIWAVLLVRFVRVDHPPVLRPERLTPARRVLAVVCLVLLALCFIPAPIQGGL